MSVREGSLEAPTRHPLDWAGALVSPALWVALVFFWMLFRSRNSIRTTYFFMLLLITTLVFFSSMWLALFLSKQITRPVEALADAMDEIADGKLDKRVSVDSSGEMAELVPPAAGALLLLLSLLYLLDGLDVQL